MQLFLPRRKEENKNSHLGTGTGRSGPPRLSPDRCGRRRAAAVAAVAKKRKKRDRREEGLQRPSWALPQTTLSTRHPRPELLSATPVPTPSAWAPPLSSSQLLLLLWCRAAACPPWRGQLRPCCWTRKERERVFFFSSPSSNKKSVIFTLSFDLGGERERSLSLCFCFSPSLLPRHISRPLSLSFTLLSRTPAGLHESTLQKKAI